MSEIKQSSLKDKKVFFAAFLIVNLFLASYYIDTWCTPNPVSHALPAFTIVENGTVQIDKYKDYTGDRSKVRDHYYSDKAPLPSFAAVPFYWLAQKLGLTKVTENTGKKYPIYIWNAVTPQDGRNFQAPFIIPLLVLGGLLFASFPFAIMLFLTLKKIAGANGTISPVILVMLAFYGSFVFVFSGTYFNHILTGFLLLLGYILIKENKYILAGLCVGLSFSCEFPVAIVMPLWALVIWLREKNIKNIIRFALGTLPGVAFIMIYNYAITGHPFKALISYSDAPVGQQIHNSYGFSAPTFQSLWGLSFSFYMGLLPHVPILLLCGYFVIKEMINRYPFRNLLYNYLVMFSIPFFFMIAANYYWWGGWSYGPRYLICLSIILLYQGVIYLSDKKVNYFVFIALAGFGLIATWLDKITLMFMIPDHSGPQGWAPGEDAFKNYILPQFNKGHFNSSNLFTIGLAIPASAAAYLWLFLFIAATAVFTLWYKQLFPVAIQQTGKSKIKSKRK
jgi:hypothetical protein